MFFRDKIEGRQSDTQETTKKVVPQSLCQESDLTCVRARRTDISRMTTPNTMSHKEINFRRPELDSRVERRIEVKKDVLDVSSRKSKLRDMKTTRHLLCVKRLVERHKNCSDS